MAEDLHKGHRKRLRREMLEQEFPESVETHKVLELLLFYGIPRKDTNPIAHELLNTFGSLSGVLEAEAADLLQVSGMTENAVALIKLILPLYRRYQTEKYKEHHRFESYSNIADFLVKKHAGYRNEVLIITTLKDNGELIASEVINKGDMTSVSLSVKAIVQNVLKHNAPSVVVSHNHVTNIALPSKKDIEMTQSLKFTLEQINVRLVDHIIVAGNDYVSLRQSQKYKSLF